MSSEYVGNEIKPEWFQRAIDAKRDDAEIEVEGCKIHYATWGEIGKPGIVMIHGSNANLEWWRFVAPFLADQFRVAAIDLSGNGDSGWRDKYSGEIYAKEVRAVCDAAQVHRHDCRNRNGYYGRCRGHHGLAGRPVDGRDTGRAQY
jgi:alpha-beta hydrolase superfamily lysophospholipase